jgi:cytochrome P450
MFGNIVGGHHTTSGAMMWITKYLTDYPEVQQNLRAVLQEALSVAWTEGRLFTFEEIRQAKVPYLDAVVEEMFRINAVPVTREAQCDTVVLGYPIKKGTQVFVMSNGPGYVSPALASKDGTLESKDRSSRPEPWSDAQNLTVFDPKRWLVRKNNGQGLNADNVTFDGAAGPQLAFGMGPRTCWGRRLAYMEIKVVISMLVWSFELQPTPAKLSDHSGLEGIARVPKQCYVRLQRIFPSSSREVE